MSRDTSHTLSLLVIDDDPHLLRSIGRFLDGQGYAVALVGTAADGVAALHKETFDIVITDVRLPDKDGFEVLHEVQRLTPLTDVILITGHREIETAFRAMREGAFDFFTKPLKVEELNASLQRTLRFRALRRENRRIQQQLARVDETARQRYGLPSMIGESVVMQEVKTRIDQVCQGDGTTVLVVGETGTGKELVARAIHTESGRNGGPFVPVDCSAISRELFESEFFGHVKGAFTGADVDRVGHFEAADGGTLFLDEIGDMDLEMQRRLLRVLEERQVRRVGASSVMDVNVRVVSATNRDLSTAVQEGMFREDLLYRLNPVTIQVPPLRNRQADILPLAYHFFQRYVRELRKPLKGFSDDAQAMLLAHHFPGNIRELRNAIERAVLLCQSDTIRGSDLDLNGSVGVQIDSGIDAVVTNDLDKDLDLVKMEKRMIVEALKRADGKKVEAARLLGISRNALSRRMGQYKIN